MCGICFNLLLYFKTKSLKTRIYIYKIYETVSVATLITRHCRLNYNFAELPASPIIASIIMHDIVNVFCVTRRCLGLLLLCSSLLFSVGLVSRICIACASCEDLDAKRFDFASMFLFHMRKKDFRQIMPTGDRQVWYKSR